MGDGANALDVARVDCLEGGQEIRLGRGRQQRRRQGDGLTSGRPEHEAVSLDDASLGLVGRVAVCTEHLAFLEHAELVHDTCRGKERVSMAQDGLKR